jgi:hypothetical protein
VTGHVRGRALDWDRGALYLGDFHAAQQHLTEEMKFRTNSIRKILPMIIGIIVCLEAAVEDEFWVKADRYTAGRAQSVMPSPKPAETNNALDRRGEGDTTDIDETIDLQVNALAALAVFLYLAQMQRKARN